ncbi:MAG: zinc ABC transporter substrate-binding protein, partial [Pseudomonadota bacterium]
MRHAISLLSLLGLLGLGTPAIAQLKVFGCEPEWSALAGELGGKHVEVFSATTGRQDPHRIEARPSLIAKLRRADLLVCSGADLEVGWLPLLLRQSANKKVQRGRPGYFEAAAVVERLDVPEKVDRILGDVHPAGNPHVHLDPRRMAQIAAALAARLQVVDPANAAHYARRHSDFAARWQSSITRWEQLAAPLRGERIVTHHRDWIYLFDWLGITAAGTLEPKPGLPPGAGHLAKLKAQLAAEPARMVVHAAHQSPRSSLWLSEQTGMPAVTLPYTVGGNEQATNLFSL